MTDIRTEATFDVASTSAQAWKAIEELRVRTTEPGQWWLPGFECRGAEVEVEVEERLTVRKLDQPCADTLITISFEHIDTGTRIRVVQSGFDEAFVKMSGDAFWIHAEHIFADVHLFFESGVIARRAWLPWAPLGIGVTVAAFGLRVTRVQPGSWAARVGLQADDVLLTVAGAPLYTARELGVIERVVKPGDDVRATCARGGERCEGSATI